MSRWRSLLATAAAALTAGCASVPPPDEAGEVAAMLAAHELAANMKAEEQRREFEAAQAAYERTPSDATRLTLALTLLLPQAPWNDDARVQSLLGGIAGAPPGRRSARRDLAELLIRLVAERQRAQQGEQRKTDRLAQQLRDERRNADQLMHQLREERRKKEEMQQKIESLRAIDKEARARRREP